MDQDLDSMELARLLIETVLLLGKKQEQELERQEQHQDLELITLI